MRPARGAWTFGYSRAEILSASVNGITLLLVAVLIAVESIRRLISPPEVPGLALVVVAGIGGLVNVAHHLGGALGIGDLETVFDAAGTASDGPRALLADRVSAALTAACLLLVLALAVTLVTRRAHPRQGAAPCRSPAAAMFRP